MQQAVYDKIKQIVHHKSGIHLKEGKKAMVTARIAKRLKALQLADEQTYLDYLLSDIQGQELTELLNVISTNVTHFYREAVHFDTSCRLVNKWQERGQSRFRIWSAASSSGEEPYTLAISLLEAWRTARTPLDLKILATDISCDMLRRATAGTYNADQLQRVPDAVRNRYFDPVGDLYRVRPEVRSMVVFKRLNITAKTLPLKGPLDIVFCRNVMIYFDRETNQRLLKEIHRLLKPGGYVFVGLTETLAGLNTNFKRIDSGAYQKAA